MSWSLFKSKCNVLTGNPHVSLTQYAFTISDAYHQAVTLHFESMTGGGRLINNAPKFPILYQQILGQCQANLASSSPSIQILNQIGPFITSYWTGISIIGPLGNVLITSPGVFTAMPIVQNNNFDIMLTTMIMCFRSHIMSLLGTYTSTVIPGVVTPFSGATLISLP